MKRKGALMPQGTRTAEFHINMFSTINQQIKINQQHNNHHQQPANNRDHFKSFNNNNIKNHSVKCHRRRQSVQYQQQKLHNHRYNLIKMLNCHRNLLLLPLCFFILFISIPCGVVGVTDDSTSTTSIISSTEIASTTTTFSEYFLCNNLSN